MPHYFMATIATVIEEGRRLLIEFHSREDEPSTWYQARPDLMYDARELVGELVVGEVRTCPTNLKAHGGRTVASWSFLEAIVPVRGAAPSLESLASRNA